MMPTADVVFPFTTEFPENWVVQTLVHEMRQPLSAIEAITYYLEMTIPPEQMEARSLLLRLHDLVQESNSILVEALSSARK
jgi:hypothetical protein